MIIPNWYHQPGKHCGSAALSDIAHFHGHPLSEPFCFGLGEGLAFYSLPTPGQSPSHRIFLRCLDLEGNFFRNIGIPFEWKTEADPEKALELAEKALEHGTPVLLRTDLRHLDYYQTKTHFAGHAIVLWGIDRGKGRAYVSDTHWEGLQELPIESLKKARWVESFPISVQNDYFEAGPFELPKDWAPVLRNTLKNNAEAMLAAGPLEGACGVLGIESLSKELPQWTEKEDRTWIGRFFYQTIEKRGTGGGAFRRLYADFLEEACPKVPELQSWKGVEQMRQIANLWTEVALHMKEFSETESPDLLSKTADRIAHLASQEKAFYQSICRLL